MEAKAVRVMMGTMCRRLLFSHMLSVLSPREDDFIREAIAEEKSRQFYTECLYAESVKKLTELHDRGDIARYFDMEEPSIRAHPADPGPPKKFWDNLFVATERVLIICTDYTQKNNLPLSVPPREAREAQARFLAEQFDNPRDPYGLAAYGKTLNAIPV